FTRGERAETASVGERKVTDAAAVARVTGSGAFRAGTAASEASAEPMFLNANRAARCCSLSPLLVISASAVMSAEIFWAGAAKATHKNTAAKNIVRRKPAIISPDEC